MSAPVQVAGHPLVVRLAKAVLWVIVATSAIIVLLTLVQGIEGIVGDLGSGATTVTLVADKALPSIARGTTTHIVHGSYDTATVSLSHASGWVAVFGVVASIGQLFAQASLAAGVGLVAWRVLRPRMFRPTLALQFTLLGAFVFLGGLVWQIGAMFAAGLAADALNSSDPHGFWPLAGRLDPTYVVVGFAFMTIGLAFEYGGRLQKETEGLV